MEDILDTEMMVGFPVWLLVAIFLVTEKESIVLTGFQKTDYCGIYETMIHVDYFGIRLERGKSGVD